MSWAQSRRLVYIGGIIIIFLLVVVLPTILHFNKAPTCFDNKQNQDEQGIDCGGVCNLLCKNQYVPLVVNWSRFSKVSTGVYNVMAYIENPNPNAGINELSYVFRLFDKEGLLLRERYGKTIAPANKVMAVFEPEMYTGNQIPQRVDFVIIQPTTWLKQNSAESALSVTQSVITQEDSAPRLSATLTNKTIYQIKNIEAVGIIYSGDNAVAFSRTMVETLNDKESVEINFNWPAPFSEKYTNTKIILKVLK
jgi:hypothetical protein